MNTENFSAEALQTPEKDTRMPVAEVQILVFRSNIDTPQKAALVRGELRKLKGVFRVNIDLQDWENILRVECRPALRASQVERELTRLGFLCTELAD